MMDTNEGRAKDAPQPAADVMGVLAELVAVKDLKERMEALHFAGPLSDSGENWKANYEAGRAEYLRRQPLAWESARRALAAGALQAEHPLDALLPEICQLIDTIKVEWTQQGCWSEWDQSVRDRIAAYNIAKMKGASAGADAAGAVPEGIELSEQWRWNLHKFLDVAAGEGYVFDGVDAGDLYEAVFPSEYKAAARQSLAKGE